MTAAAGRRTLTSRHDATTQLQTSGSVVAFSDPLRPKGTGARFVRRAGRLFALLALTTFSLALAAGSAIAASPSVTIGSVSNVFSASAHVTGTVDPAGNYVFYSFEYSTDGVTWSGFAYQGAFEGNGSQPVSSTLTGLKPETTYFVRLAATDFSDPEAISAEPNPEFTTTPEPVFVKPTVLGVSAGVAAYTTAMVSASVERPAGPDPGFDVHCHFEYVTDAQFTATGFEGAAEAACVPQPLTTTGANPVTAELTGLARGTTYHLRLTASNAGGSDSLEAANFTTSMTPQAQTLGAGSVTAESATLAGRINPANATVTYQFEWGATNSYGSSLPATPKQMSVADESFDVVTAPLTGLRAASTYHYRVVATNTQTNETVQGQDRVFTTPPASFPSSVCPNESSRFGFSADLPDCRVYEFASPGLNNASISPPNGVARADGGAVAFQVIDAPDKAEGSSVSGMVMARRGPQGWSTESLVPPMVEPADGFASTGVIGVSSDFSEALVFTPQPLVGPSSPSGDSLYMRHADRTFTPIMTKGNPFEPFIDIFPQASQAYPSQDYSHVWFVGLENQIGVGPIGIWEWSDDQVRALGILPGPAKAPSPEGANLAESVGRLSFASSDGKRVLFRAQGLSGLYLQSNAQESVEVSASQRTVNPDPNPQASPTSVGVTGDGAKVLFTSASELTNDANTGNKAGEASDAGADLYLYSVQTGALTDLTVDNNPADQATGARVQSVVGVSADASYVYFLATGDLAPGGASGSLSLYVEHEQKIDFIAPAERLNPLKFTVTPDGRYAAFASRDELTGYDNVKPTTHSPEEEIYKYSYGGGLYCASCRADGRPPIDGTGIGTPGNLVLSVDGSRLFFQSIVAVIPQASNSHSKVYEYEDGVVHLLFAAGASNGVLLDASASGDDVFIMAREELTPSGQNQNSAVYDARVGADATPSVSPECTGEGCLGAAAGPPIFGTPGSTSLSGAGNVSAPPVKAKRITKPKAKAKCKKGFVKKRAKCVRHKSKSSKRATKGGK